jgi:uncharacterized integral membrane protein (TIGR00697 family)
MEMKKSILQSIFIGSLITANIIAVKLIGTRFIQSAGIIVYPITFLITDSIGEVFGKKEAKQTVLLGFIAQIFCLIFIIIARFLPYPIFWDGQEAYVRILGFVPRLVLASMVAYLVSQYHDVWAFHFWKDKTSGKYLWLRNNASTIVSQLIDSCIFVSIAFIGTIPWGVFFSMVLIQYVSKVLIALIDTPFCYLIVRWLRK